MDNQNHYNWETHKTFQKSKIFFKLLIFCMYYIFQGLNLNIFLFLDNELFNLYGIANVEKLAKGIRIAAFWKFETEWD